MRGIDSERHERSLTRVGRFPLEWKSGSRQGVRAPPAIPPSQRLNQRHLRFASTHAYIAAMDLKFWQKAIREAERELDAATRRTALDAAAKKFMRAKAELKRLQAEVSA